MHTPAMRIKSHWFKAGAGRSAADQASAMAFIVWRVAHNLLKRMRGARFDIDAGRPYLDFLREVLVFLIALTDRIAFERLSADDRQAFTESLVRHVARTLQGNEHDLLGPPPEGAPAVADAFIDFVNEVVGHYGEFGAHPSPPPDAVGFHPDFGFVRYLGSRLEPTLPDKDRRWVLDQVAALEAPEAVGIVQRSMRDPLAPDEARPRRRGLSGD
jgi:hypothetical protein